MAIASTMVFHEVLFLLDEQYPLGIDRIGKSNYSFKTYEDSGDLFEILRAYNPHIVLNDILDTSREYISSLKEEGYLKVLQYSFKKQGGAETQKNSCLFATNSVEMLKMTIWHQI